MRRDGMREAGAQPGFVLYALQPAPQGGNAGPVPQRHRSGQSGAYTPTAETCEAAPVGRQSVLGRGVRDSTDRTQPLREALSARYAVRQSAAPDSCSARLPDSLRSAGLYGHGCCSYAVPESRRAGASIQPYNGGNGWVAHGVSGVRFHSAPSCRSRPRYGRVPRRALLELQYRARAVGRRPETGSCAVEVSQQVGTARELLVDALERWEQTPWAGGVVLPVHDEIVAPVPAADATAATAALVTAMTTELYGVPIAAEASEPSFAWQDAT